MANILNASEGLTKKDIYKLTKQGCSVKDAVGSIIDYAGFVEYEEDNSKGERVEILAILDKAGDAYSTTSPTFKREFHDILDMFADDPEGIPGIRITTGVSKSGRSFMTCTIE